MAIQVLGIIYLPNVGKAVSKVGKFTRCPAHGNVLAWLGRPLPIAEFNVEAPKVLVNASIYGMQPLVKLVEVGTADPVPAPVSQEPEKKVDGSNLTSNSVQTPETQVPASLTGAGYSVEPLNDGFVALDTRAEATLYRGQGEQWENDISLVVPFATEAEARAVIPGEATKPAAKAEEKPAAETPAASSKPKAKAKAPAKKATKPAAKAEEKPVAETPAA